MRFWTWLRERSDAERAARRGRQKFRKLSSRPTPRFRPLLEALEDRCVPSTLTVTNSGDDVNMPGTLRYDIAHAQSGDTILLTGAVKSGIELTHGELVLNQDVTITSAGNHQITISGGGHSRVFEVAAGTHVTLASLAITDGIGVADNPDGSSQFDGDGGGILNFGDLTVNGSTLSDNSTSQGGGIYNASGTVGGTLTVNDSILSGNSATRSGGGIYNSFGAPVTISGSSLSGNSANGGGGIENDFGTVTVGDSTLSGNSAANGGGIDNVQGTAIVSGSTLSGNSAIRGMGEGGGIWNDGTLTVNNSTLSGNSASQGGGIENVQGTVTISGSILSGSSATDFGGGIFNEGVLTVSDTTLSDNSANFGGGIFNQLGAVAVSDSILSGNSAIQSFGEGGGIFNFGTLTVSASTLTGNSATDGGGIWNEGPAGSLTLSDSILSDNSATDGGGGIYNLNGALTANDSTVCGNNAPRGADLFLAGGVLINNNSTICDIFP